MDLNSIISQVKSMIHSGGGVEFSFGSPSQIGDVSIVPVARTTFAFGGGGGSSSAKKTKKKPVEPADPNPSETPEEFAPKEQEADFGGGGGGSMKTDPVGIYTIKADKVSFHPVVSINELIAIFGILSILILKLMKLRRTRR